MPLSGATSGKISVGTAKGVGVSSSDFLVPPNGFTTADILNSTRLTFGTASTLTVGTANKIALGLFDGVSGRRVSMNVTGVTISSVTLSLNTPAGATLKSLTVNTSGTFMEPISLPMSGTYTIIIDPVGTATGNVTLTLYDMPADVTGTLTSGVTSSPLIFTTPGQNGVLTFSGTAGNRLSVLVTSTTFATATCGQNGFSVSQPDGLPVMVTPNTTMSGSFCLNSFIDSPVLTQTGTYTIVLNPGTINTGQITMTMWHYADALGPIASGTATTATTTIPGQKAGLTFTGSVGQKVSIQVNSTNITTCANGTLRLLGPSVSVGGPTLCAGQFLDRQTLTTAGTYTIELDPAGTDTGQVTVTLYNITDVSGTITPGVATTMTTTVPGQNAAFTFSGNVNQRAAIRGNSLTTLSQTYLSILKADGTSLGVFNYPSSAFLEGVTLPETGTYTLYHDPISSETGQANVTVYVFNHVIGTLTINAAPTPVTIPIITQRAFSTFTGNAGQAVTVRVTDNTMGFVTVQLRKADATVLTSISTNGANFTLSTVTLPAAGTYVVAMDPQAMNTGTLNLQVTSP